MLEQHYGMATAGLDVTFDLKTALFFASHRFVRQADGRCRYERVPAGQHRGLVYCLVFIDPALTRSSDAVEAIPIFEHLDPRRVYRQQCALPIFDADAVNEAICHARLILELTHDFDITGLPRSQYLFPPSSEDTFYGALLNAKREHPEFFGDVVEYVHES